MDFDFKIYIPLIASCITSTIALIVGVINWRTNIKIRNQQVLINILEKDISQIIEVNSCIYEKIPRLLTIKNNLETVTFNLEQFYEFYDFKQLIDYKILGINAILQESAQVEDFYCITSSFSDDFKPFYQLNLKSTPDVQIISAIINCMGIYLNKLSLVSTMLNNELITKRQNIKNLLL
ncbi:hypothetical protein [Nostoc sp. FACHB-145]|uniref:hypothetical protein n=1 Tax=Nostoc sp. FACHB-145 TaxID=2692836 RepID=UPI00168710DF|nr:hypothetical protein [Nostoc sp. FACHB-145]MBD2472250.1 hypothetical protein [Nostoc sp. FACHB-145]